ncbi:MAG: InlB B-repeat-containing protein, partial [Lachnospiraceae bacterium]|nr:InlB B-repeat-containing protein [Lachnospiraceae bacterium]
MGTLPKTEEAPGVGNDMTPSAGAAGDGQQSQDSDGEYYVVSFYSDGVLQETREVRTGEKLSAFPEPVKEGYQFIGWAIAEENGEDFDPDIAITQTMDLYAKWEILVEAMLLEEDVMPVSAQEVSYSTDGGSTWKEGTLGEALNACQSASQPAEIKLLQDITLTGDNWDSPRLLAERSDVTIDGQGYTITRGEGAGGTDARRGSLLMLNQPRTVTLKNITIDGGAIWQGSDPKTRINVGIDCSNQGSLILVEAGGTLILEAGTVLQNNDVRGSGYTSGSGGAIRLGGEPDLLDTSKGKVIMKSGAVIRDNTACGGGGVFINMGSVFELQGGIICGNYARTNRGDSGNGGGVYNSGTFIMTDGEVSGNVAYDGAGLYNGGTIATAQMSGGSISNNVALRRGGGVQCGNNKFSMSGGSIFGNKSGKDGGGIGVDTYGIKTCQIEISGGSIVDNTTGTSGGGIFVEEGNEMKVSGNPVITGNTKNGEASNLYLESGDLISLMGAMTQGASIGVTYGSTGQEAVFSSGWTTQMGEAEKPENYFSSDRSDFIVVKDAATNEAKLVRHTHVFGTEWKWDDGAHWHECDCGARIDQEAHREDDGTVTKEPTETEAGEKKYQCIVCGHERTEILPATGSGNDDNQGGGENQGGDGNKQGGDKQDHPGAEKKHDKDGTK